MVTEREMGFAGMLAPSRKWMRMLNRMMGFLNRSLPNFILLIQAGKLSIGYDSGLLR